MSVICLLLLLLIDSLCSKILSANSWPSLFIVVGIIRSKLCFLIVFWNPSGFLHSSKKNPHETHFFEENSAREALFRRTTRTKPHFSRNSPAFEALFLRKTSTKPHLSRKTLGLKRFIITFNSKWAQEPRI